MSKPINAEAEAQQEAAQENDSKQERRSQPNEKLRERRVIERISDPALRTFAQQIGFVSSVLTVFSVIFVSFELYQKFNADAWTRNRTIFMSAVIFATNVAIWRLRSSVHSFLSNESKNRLVHLVEKMRNLFFLIAFFSLTMGVVYLLNYL